jgi:hypothetical protein
VTERALISEPGRYDIPLAEYLADPAPAPSLSAGIANTLLERSPWHAWNEHPRLGKRPGEPPEYRRDAAIGTVFSHAFLGAGGSYRVIDCADFRSNAAKDARDEALALGITPIKARDFEVVETMVLAAKKQLDAHEIGDFRKIPGKAEQTLLWLEGKVWCRIGIDWMPDDLLAHLYIVNVKTTVNAHPDVYVRRVFGTGYDLSAAHYTRGVLKVFGVEVSERFVVVETKPPYALSVIDLSPGALFMAEKRRAAAVQLWGECLARDSFPGYPARVATIDMPPYLETRQTDRELAGHYDTTMLDNLIEMGAP